MQIVLATPPADGDTWGIGSFPTLGLAYLASSVMSIPGMKVTVVDGLAEGLDLAEATERVLSVDPDMLGVTVTSMTIERGLKLIKSVKQCRPDVVTIVGGHHATVFDSLLLNEVRELDFVLRGEGEESFPDLCERLTRSEDVSGVMGLTYRAHGKVIRGIPQAVSDLDSIPFPDRDVFTYEGYGTQWAGFFIPPVFSGGLATMVTSRGCPYRCTFCAKTSPQLGRYRARSAENVFREVRELAAGGYSAVGFVDENFSYDVKRVTVLCRMILEHDLGLRFFFQGSLHHLSQSVLDLMHEAGFDLAMVGVESGSDAQLRRYNKPAASSALASGIRRAKQAHLFVVAFFIDGGPGETEEDHHSTLQFIRDVKPHICATGELVVHPGSKLWESMVDADLPHQSVESSRALMIHVFEGQLDKSEIDLRIRSFQKAFAESWRHWRRLRDVLDLMIHNPTIRTLIISVFRYPTAYLQLIGKPGASPSARRSLIPRLLERLRSRRIALGS